MFSTVGSSVNSSSMGNICETKMVFKKDITVNFVVFKILHGHTFEFML